MKLIRNVAIVIFTDGKDIAIQLRGNHSKAGEKYGFWGGHIEDGETPEVAVKREIREELSFELKHPTYLGSFPFVVQEESEWKGRVINQEVFVAPMSEIPKDPKIEEGDGIVNMSVDRVIKGEGFLSGCTYFIKKIPFSRFA